jgi:hypothetical protein
MGESRVARESHARAGLPRLVFFTSSTSGACRRADALVAQVLQHRRNYQRVRVVKVEAEKRPELERFQVERLPTLVVVDEKVAKARLECPRETREIRALLGPWLSAS